MSQLISILRAAHCRSTHHYLAIDALSAIETAQGLRLRDLLLRHYDEYLTGAKAPDNTFKDFQNHVHHVSDNHWGGATAACERWLETTLDHLNRKRWKKAAYACGVLSHYFTDPIMPLHTAQSERESLVHRPMEWSVCKAYDAILGLDVSNDCQVEFQLSNASDWMSKAVVAAATLAHGHYDRLIELYDLERGVKDPPAGLDQTSRQILHELLHVAIAGWGAVLSRIADEAAVDIPKTSLSLTTLLATIDMPLAWLVRRISNASEQRAVTKIFREYAATGAVTINLPPEVRVVRQARAAQAGELGPSAAGLPSSANDEPDQTLSQVPEQTEQPQLPEVESQSEASAPQVFEFAALNELVLPSLTTAAQSPESTSGPAARVNYQSNLVEAPSIGPKTAQRFADIGINTIGQFLSANPTVMSIRLATRWITRELLIDWQDQAGLVCDCPALCGYKAQLLVAVDCRSASQLAEFSLADLSDRLHRFYETQAAERILRSSLPPTESEIATWIHSARNHRVRLAG